ncbi:MAG: VOC family protein [Pseudonocardiaceae bacterium]
MTRVVGFHHLSLSVSDLAKSTAWYQQVLGLDVAAEFEGDGFRRTRLRAADSGVTLTLTRHDEQSGEAFDERRPGMDHVAIQVGSAEEVQDLKARFEQLGVDHSDVKASNEGTALITLRDPDNIQIEVFGGPLDPAIAAGNAGN